MILYSYYSLWVLPSLLPYFTTHAQVLPKLANGAHLMMPGVVKKGSDLKSFGRFQKDQIVAVNLTSNSSAVGVGVLAKDSEDLYMSGGHGICVQMLHVFGDKLWGMEISVTQQIPVGIPVVRAPIISSEEDFPALGMEPPRREKLEDVQHLVQNLNLDNENRALTEESSVIEASVDSDVVLKKMFLSGLKLNKKELVNSLPLLVSTFFPKFVQKQAQPDKSKPVTIKDTSFKKVSTFIKKMAEEGFIKVCEESKGVEKITHINYEHPEMVLHVPLKSEDSADKPGTSSNLLLTEMTELYVVNEATVKLFNSLGVPLGKALDTSQIKNYVKDYVSRKKLLNSITKDVTLDDVLVEICIGQRENDKEIVLSLEKIVTIIHTNMEQTFEMRSQSSAPTKKGKKQLIQITTATRMGNKKVTLVSNLESYGINMVEFSKACKVGVQASTSITKVPGTNTNQFQIQGNHVRFVYNLLVETYQVSKPNITGLEFAKKDKNKKK